MVNITIDGKQISVRENTTIMEAAAQNGIQIPKLCFSLLLIRTSPPFHTQ